MSWSSAVVTRMPPRSDTESLEFASIETLYVPTELPLYATYPVGLDIPGIPPLLTDGGATSLRVNGCCHGRRFLRVSVRRGRDTVCTSGAALLADAEVDVFGECWFIQPNKDRIMDAKPKNRFL